MFKKIIILSTGACIGFCIDVYGDTNDTAPTIQNSQTIHSADTSNVGFNPGQKLPMQWASMTWDQAVLLSGDDAATLKSRIQNVYQSAPSQKQDIEKDYPAQIEGFLKLYNASPAGHQAAGYRKELGRRVCILMAVQGKAPIQKEALVVNDLSTMTPLKDLAKAAGMNVNAAQNIIDTYAQKHGVKDEKTKQKVRDYLNESIQTFQKQRVDTSLDDSLRINATKQVAKNILNLLSIEKAQIS